MGVNGFTILNNAKKEGIKIIQGKQKDGHSIQLVPERFIKGLVISHECEMGEKVEIDGVVYIGVVTSKEMMGIPGETILNHAKKQKIQVIQGKQKDGRSIQLVPLSFIEELKKRQK